MKGAKRGRTRRTPTQTRPAPLQVATTGTLPGAARPPLNQMTPDELRAWIGRTRAALERKQARERAYLDRRAARGTRTPTDEAYEADQELEADLLDMLNELERFVALMQPYKEENITCRNRKKTPERTRSSPRAIRAAMPWMNRVAAM